MFIMKNKNYHTAKNSSKLQQENCKHQDKIDTLNTDIIHDRSLGRGTSAVPALDKERLQAIPHMRPLSIDHIHDWRRMKAYLVNCNKGEDDEGCLKFCNILKCRSATEQGKLLKGCFESTVRYDSIYKCESPITV